MLFTFIDSLKALVQAIKGNLVRRNGHLRLYRQPDYGQVRRISPSDVPEYWKCTKALCASHRAENEPLRTVFVLTSDKEVKSLPFMNYMEEFYGHEIKTMPRARSDVSRADRLTCQTPLQALSEELISLFLEEQRRSVDMRLNHAGTPLSKSELLSNYRQHSIFCQKKPTALVSATDRPIEALHRAFVKHYHSDDREDGIWIAIISVPVGEDGPLPCHHARDLALELGYNPDDGDKFMHEYIFEWEIEHQYVEHVVSVKTLLDRGLDLDAFLQDNRMPSLREFRDLMIYMIVEPPADGYSVGRELGRMARCFGARAPVEEIAHSFLTDCPTNIFVDNDRQNVTWKRSGAEPVDIDFEHIYWISQGIDEAFFDLWLAGSNFTEDRITHAALANALTSEIEILWELYWEDIYFEVWNGVNSDSAADEARKLRCREQEIHNQIERHAVSIGL